MINFLSVLFGNRFPSTQKYENYLDQTKADYERFLEFEKSPLLARYNDLEEEINSGEFEKRVKELKTLRYKNSKEWRELKQYNTLKKSSDIKRYLKLKHDGVFNRIEEIETSDLFKTYSSLKEFINSPEYYSEKSKKGFKKSDAYQKQVEFKNLRKNSEIKFYTKTVKSNNYKIAQDLEGKDRLKAFYELEAYVMSDDFKEQTNFLKDKNRFDKSKEAELIEEYKELGKNEEIKWYKDKIKTKPFEEIKKWNLTFSDDFDQSKLDKNKWMTGYYWGRALLNENYVPENELQFFSNNNIYIQDSVATITVQDDNVSGKSWSTVNGFSVREFNYTSGLLSTGQSFRMKYGKIQAKVSFEDTYPIVNAFWLVGEKQTPQIDIFRTIDKRKRSVRSGLVYENEKYLRQVRGPLFGNRFHIYGLEWNEDEIIWTINGKVVNKQTTNIPQEDMYLTFCTIVLDTPKEQRIPSKMEIDWVRCYSKNE